MENLSWIALLRERRWYSYVVALIGCSLALLIRLVPHFPFAASPFLSFFPAILLATLCGGWPPGTLAVAIAAGLGDGILVPRLGFSAMSPTAAIITLTFILVAVLMVALLDHAQRVTRRVALATGALSAANASLEREVETRTAALMLAETRLRQNQKMEAVGKLTGGIAHDFNNLLTNIGCTLEILQTRLHEGRTEDMESHIAEAQEASHRAAALTHRLLAFSGKQALAPRPTDLNQLLAGLESTIRRTAGSDIAVSFTLAPGLWCVRADQRQLELAILNLCLNAVEAMPKGGSLAFETRNRFIEPPAFDPRQIAAADHVSLCVTDTGPGMTPEMVEHAFDPFFTTKPAGQGTGLGLSMVHGFVRQSGGDVRIESPASRGVRVIITLPRHQGAVAAAMPARPAHAPVVLPAPQLAAVPGQTVMVVDDELVIRMFIAASLRSRGFTVLEAADAEEGALLLQTAARLDLLITDIGLPGMNGRQFADIARLSYPASKILFITGYAESALRGAADLAPGMDVLTKPFPMATLLACVQRIMAEVAAPAVACCNAAASPPRTQAM